MEGDVAETSAGGEPPGEGAPALSSAVARGAAWKFMPFRLDVHVILKRRFGGRLVLDSAGTPCGALSSEYAAGSCAARGSSGLAECSRCTHAGGAAPAPLLWNKPPLLPAAECSRRWSHAC